MSRIWYILSLLMFLHHCTHVVWDTWELHLIWEMSWEKWFGTIALLMDASCTAILPMSRMNDVSLTWSLAIESDWSSPFGYVDWILSIDYLLFISMFSRVEQRWDIEMVHDERMAWWFMMDGLAGGIVPSWEEVLKLETRANFHIGQLLWER